MLGKAEPWLLPDSRALRVCGQVVGLTLTFVIFHRFNAVHVA